MKRKLLIITESLPQAYLELYDALVELPREDGYNFATHLSNIDEYKLKEKVKILISLSNEIYKLKAVNPKKLK